MKPKKDYQNKQEINTENYLTKKSVKKKENMEEIDIKVCLKKLIKRLKIYQKSYFKEKNQQKKIFIFSFLHGIKIEQKVLIFAKQCINRNSLKIVLIKIKMY